MAERDYEMFGFKGKMAAQAPESDDVAVVNFEIYRMEISGSNSYRTLANVEIDYYPNDRLSFGGAIKINESSSLDGFVTYGVGAQYFLLDNLAIAGKFSLDRFAPQDEQTTNTPNRERFELVLTGRL